jgi:hypothetical protein
LLLLIDLSCTWLRLFTLIAIFLDAKKSNTLRPEFSYKHRLFLFCQALPAIHFRHIDVQKNKMRQLKRLFFFRTSNAFLPAGTKQAFCSTIIARNRVIRKFEIGFFNVAIAIHHISRRASSNVPSFFSKTVLPLAHKSFHISAHTSLPDLPIISGCLPPITKR